jgi:hypothetical protein
MANFVYITLDTTAPSNPVITISGGAIYATNQLVNLNISVGDADTTGYQMLIWGDVDTAYNTSIQTTEETSQWIAYSTTPQVKLSSGDGSKSINIRVRDDVYNPSSIAVDSITMDTSIPTVTVTTPDVSKISKQTGKNTSTFTFQSNQDFVAYKVKLVGTTGATHDTGQQIPTTGGSANVQGTGTFTSATVTTVTLKAIDLETALANMNGQNIIKVFVQDDASNWSA